jgi:acyl carrier protein
MDIIEILKKGICEINILIKEEAIPEDENLMELGILDSFGFVEFVSFIENKFGLDFADEEIVLKNFRSLKITEEFIKSKTKK